MLPNYVQDFNIITDLGKEWPLNIVFVLKYKIPILIKLDATEPRTNILKKPSNNSSFLIH